MEGIMNDSTVLHELINGSTTVERPHGTNSPLLRILYSYDAVNKAIIPILFLFGTIGNALSLTVFCMAPSHRHLSSSYYLSALAISDTGFLINLLAVWLEDMGYRVITSGLMCPLVMYLGQVTCFLSVWLTVSFTVERFFAVCYPLTRPTVCTVARAKKVISVLTLSALIAFSYVWLIARVLDYPMPPGNPITDADGAAVMGGGGGSSSEILERMSPSLEVGNFSLENISGGATIPACAEFTMENTSGGGEPQQADMFSAVLSCNNGTAAGSSLNDSSDGDSSMVGEMLTLCSVREEHIYISSIASHIDSLLTLIFPFFIITYLNVRIAVCVWKLKDQRKNIVASTKITNSCSNTLQQQQQSQAQQQQLLTSNKGDPSSGCHRGGGLASSRSNPLLNGMGNSSISSGASLNNHFTNSKGFRINMGSSSTSLNSGTAPSSMTAARNTVHKGQSHQSTSAAEARVTKTLLLVSTSFLVLNLPAHAIRAVAYIQSLWDLEMVEELQAAQQWANILFNMNFSVNFLLYCVSGRNFRKSLYSIFFNRSGGGRSNLKSTTTGRMVGRQQGNKNRRESKLQNNSSSGIGATTTGTRLLSQHQRFTVQQQQQHHQNEKQSKINVSMD